MPDCNFYSGKTIFTALLLAHMIYSNQNHAITHFLYACGTFELTFAVDVDMHVNIDDLYNFMELKP